MNDLIRREDLENWLRTECYGTDTYDDKEYVIGRLREELPTVAASPWHRVDEELPKDGEWVLIWGDGFHVPIQAFHESGSWIDDQFEKYTATHWMPLPEPPKEEEHGN